ncbi:MAG TPA: EamA family transporter [Bryobacteraceae bacterium]|nr:EamA family transporter [Bryobacteraceae bacterium]
MGSRAHWLPYIALAAVCFFWGTTYLGIRMALESFPPLLLVSLRFLLSGSILLAWARYRGWALPDRRELLRTSAFGLLLLGVANGCLTFAETWIPSGLASLFLTTAPFWLVGLEALQPQGERLTAPVAVGLLVGLAGVVVLVMPGGGTWDMGPNLWKGFLVLQVGSFAWNAGSILQRRWRATTPPLLTGAIQQMAAGIVYLIAALAIPERPVTLSATGAAGLLWLVTFGSIVGYSAYIYSLETLPVSLVSIYTFINPVVAIALGKLFYDEAFGRKEVLAMGIIFAGVLIVKLRTTLSPSLWRPQRRPESSGA